MRSWFLQPKVVEGMVDKLADIYVQFHSIVILELTRHLLRNSSCCIVTSGNDRQSVQSTMLMCTVLFSVQIAS